MRRQDFLQRQEEFRLEFHQEQVAKRAENAGKNLLLFFNHLDFQKIKIN